MSKWNPDDHLPECGYTGSVHDVCICEELRACEQRVRNDLSLVRVSVEDDPKELERIATFEFKRTADVRADERAKTLDAAANEISRVVCDRLRACEQRVREDGLYVSGVNVGYESGLAKAQEAVEAHRVRGYRCSCGAEVNSINGHLSSIITGLREGAK